MLNIPAKPGENMKKITVNLKKRTYNIIIGPQTLKSAGKYLSDLAIGDFAYIISNPLIYKKYGLQIEKILKKHGFDLKKRLVPDSEKSKSFEVAGSIIRDMAVSARKRRVFVIALGGGVIGDMAGFVASIYKRGVPYIQIPTTLLAQVDSSIGGKTAVDLSVGKNLVGSFYQPVLVLTDPVLLKTLPSRQIKSGLAEIIKYACIKNRRLFTYLQDNMEKILELDLKALEFIIASCCRIKAEIVSYDERETKSFRTILNFGHTLGHAIETAGNYKAYNHGEAVALGMLLAADISEKLSLTGKSTVKRIESLIKRAGLPDKLMKIPLNKVISAHYHDKKFIGSKNRFVLISKIGKTLIKENIPIEVIKETIQNRLKKR